MLADVSAAYGLVTGVSGVFVQVNGPSAGPTAVLPEIAARTPTARAYDVG